LQAKDDNSELELASIEQQRADEDVRKLLDDQEVCALLFNLVFWVVVLNSRDDY
jgi:hypothetical protein